MPIKPGLTSYGKGVYSRVEEHARIKPGALRDMFIDRKEANRRIQNSTGVLSRIRPAASPETPSQGGNGNGSPISRESNSPVPSITETPGEFSEGALKSLLNVKKPGTGPRMTTRARADLGMTSLLVGQRKAGALLGRSNNTAFAHSKGYLSQGTMYGDNPVQNEDLVNELDKQKKTIRDLAFDRITSAVSLITHEKLEKLADVTKLARVSRDLVTIVDKTLPKEQAINSGVHFHIWKPEMKEESQYEVINVNAPR